MALFAVLYWTHYRSLCLTFMKSYGKLFPFAIKFLVHDSFQKRKKQKLFNKLVKKPPKGVSSVTADTYYFLLQ